MTDINIKLQQLDVTNATDNATLVYSQANNTLEYKVVTTDTSALETSINTVNANVDALPDSAANDYSTYTTVTGLIDTVQANLTSVIGASPTALDTLAEIAAALENDANIAATLTTSIGTVSDNVDSLTSTTAANDYSTYNTLSSLIDTVQDNVSSQSSNTSIVAGGTDLSNTTVFIEAGDGVLLSSNTTSKTMTIATSMSNVTSQTISIDGTANSFTLTKSASNANMILVMYNGLVQDPSRYTISGTTLTLNNVAPIIAGANVEVRYFDFFSLPGVSESSGGGGGYTFQGSTSGYISGGSEGATLTDKIEKFPFASDTNSTNIGVLTTAKYSRAGSHSSTHGYTTKGDLGIDKFPFSSDSNATNVGDLVSNWNGAGQSSETHGYKSGFGYGASVDKYPFSSDTSATTVLNLTQGRRNGAGQSSSTHGYTSGGQSPATVDTIDKFPFSSDTDAVDVGELAVARYTLGGQSSSTHGYTSGGATPTSNYIQKFSFSSDGNASITAYTPIDIQVSGAVSSTDFGYYAGGYDNTNTQVNSINKFSFNTDSNATDVGDLTGNRILSSGTQI